VPNVHAGMAAAGAGVLVDGIRLHAFLEELSRLMEEAIARDEEERCPKGHGADARRKLGIDPVEFLDELLADEKARARLKKAIAAKERTSDHVTQAVMRKRECNATYDMIDAYRSLFLVKHPSRGAIVAETKRLVAYLRIRSRGRSRQRSVRPRTVACQTRACQMQCPNSRQKLLTMMSLRNRWTLNRRTLHQRTPHPWTKRRVRSLQQLSMTDLPCSTLTLTQVCQLQRPNGQKWLKTMSLRNRWTLHRRTLHRRTLHPWTKPRNSLRLRLHLRLRALTWHVAKRG